MSKGLVICPICSFEGSLTSFVQRKKGRVVEKVYFKCPACQRELSLKNQKKIILICVSVLFFFISSFIMGIPKGVAGIISGVILCCVWGLQKSGYLVVRFIPQSK